MSEQREKRSLLDISAFVGPYPFRHVPHPDAASLCAVMKREGITHAVVGYLPAAWHRAVAPANAELYGAISPHASMLFPAPAINPAWPGWEGELEDAERRSAPAVRIYPNQWGGAPAAGVIDNLMAALARNEMALILTTRFEDSRQRHWMDSAGDLTAATARLFARAHPGARVVVTCAGRSLIEEIHWSLTPSERQRVWYDISWIWGPPQNDLAHLLRTIGVERFAFGSMWPLRLVQTPFANIELLPDDLREVHFPASRTVMPRLPAAAG